MTDADEVARMGRVTDLKQLHPDSSAPVPPAADGAVATAALAADAAADAARVRLREMSDLADLEAVCVLLATIWQSAPGSPPMTVELLRALTKAGNYVSGAFEGEQLVGACVGFFAAPAEASLHSHIAGVLGSTAGRSLGFALKLHQRAWAMQRGLKSITWTFDPLVSRNAYFNLAKLGTAPTQYLPNFYGGMHDGINGDDDTDRLLVRWDLADPAVVAACTGSVRRVDAQAELARGAVTVLDRSPDGLPVQLLPVGPGSALAAGGTALVAVPRDIETLRSVDPVQARQWRVALRDVLTTVMADGGRITGFDRSGWYVVNTERGTL
jgi:predicted GNAT superfamily acetyltransferase